jgi:putative tryptophan/tyrosine transport system substrate-binding protein
MIARRTLLAGALGVFLTPFGHAQQATRVVRVGLFANTPEPEWAAFRKTLRERGWIEGQNLVLEERWMMGDARRAGELAANLVGLKPDVLVASSSTQTEALRSLTRTIPIVFLLHADPVGSGHVASLARPGGNITGGVCAAAWPRSGHGRGESRRGTGGGICHHGARAGRSASRPRLAPHLP